VIAELVSVVAWGGAAFFATLFVADTWEWFAISRTRDLVRRLEDLEVDVSSAPVFLWLWGVVVAILSIGVGTSMPPIGLLLAGLALYNSRPLLGYFIRRQERAFRTQLVGAASALVNVSGANLDPRRGLEIVAEECPAPLGLTMKRIVRQEADGLRLEDVLESASKRLRIDEFTLFSNAIRVFRRQGSDVRPTLDRISSFLRESERLAGKIDADTAAGYTAVVVLSAFPLIFLTGFWLADPEAIGGLFQSLPGQLCIAVVIGICYVSYMWCMWLLKIEV
jgi:tight adherence protein B